MTYGAGSTSGTSTSTVKSFKQNYSVTASTGAGFLGSGGEIAASFSYGRSTADTKAIDLKKTSGTQINHRGPAIDGIDHDRDQIWLWLNPTVEVTVGASGGEWKIPGPQTMDIQYVYVGHLKNPSLMPPGLASRLQSYGFTTEDYAEILKANPYAYGTPALDTNRYKPLQTTFPYEPPYAPGDPVPTFSFNASFSNTWTGTTSTTNEYGTGLKITGTADIAILKAKLVAEGKWTWSDTDTQSASAGTTETAQVTVGGPSYGYAGPTNMAVYYDVIYKSFLFRPVEGPLLVLEGSVKSRSGESVGGREVVMTGADGVEYRTFTNARGEYRFFDRAAAPATLKTGTTQRTLAKTSASDSVDIVIP